MGIISIFDRSIYPYILILFNLIIHRLNVVYYIYYRYSHIHNYIIIYNMYCVCTHILYLICVQIRFYILNYVCTNTIIYIYILYTPNMFHSKSSCWKTPLDVLACTSRQLIHEVHLQALIWNPWWFGVSSFDTMYSLHIYICIYVTIYIYNTIRYQW
jgi:hypothetical protein